MSGVAVQLGMFGRADLPETHVVSAHTRQLADGSSAFVGEHLRWNRGRGTSAGPRRAEAPEPVPEEQVPLFPSR